MKYINPILKGFNPDPSICKVNDDYYIVTSSFEYFPGIAIYHSKNLVNWEQIGNCIERLEQLPMEKAKASGGIWAPTIRYNDGIFYITATFDGIGNFIIYSKNPSTGWSNPIWVEMDGIDPSMYFENGKMYYCANDCGSRGRLYNTEGISLAEVSVKTGKVTGKIRRIWEGTGGGFLEAPHIYKINEWYYLLTSEGGTSFNHHITLARSKNIWGEYEAYKDNPILTNRNDTTKQIACSGHGDLIKDKNENWWLVHLGTRPANGLMSHIGRETFLMPVVLENGWLKVGEDKKSHIEVEAPILDKQEHISVWKADFKKDIPEAQWLFIRKPIKENYILKNGSLILNPTDVKLEDKNLSPTFIAVRQWDINCRINAKLNFVTNEDNDEAGLVLYLSDNYFYYMCKKRINGIDYLQAGRKAEDFKQVIYCRRVEEGTLNLKIKADKESYEFYYSVNGEELKSIGKMASKFLSCELAGKCFTGVLCGLYAQCSDKTASKAIIEEFETGDIN